MAMKSKGPGAAGTAHGDQGGVAGNNDPQNSSGASAAQAKAKASRERQRKRKDRNWGPWAAPGEPHEGRPTAPAFTEEALALEFAEDAYDLRYVAAWGRWFRWVGYKWQEEKTLYAFDRARALCRQQYRLSEKTEHKRRDLLTAKTVAAVVRLAQSDRRIAGTIEQWDADPWLLNTPGGCVDLTTGELREHYSTDYCTKCTAVTPDPDCPIPQWKAFLAWNTQGDEDLQAYKQRWYGYCLSGVTTEHIFRFSWGTGDNGKSTEINTIADLMGDYHHTAPIETFMETKQDRHLTEVADLVGARFVTSSETAEGRYWNEERIKRLTGGDEMAARFMRMDLFRFKPQLKLDLSGNHKPNLRTANQANKRRIHMNHFSATISAEMKDRNLPEKLKAEWPGILSWQIQGCLEWQRQGLAPPKAVVDSSEEYFASEDTLGEWISDCCIKDNAAFTSTTLLFGSYKIWNEDAGGYPITEKRFAKQLEDRGGFRRDRVGYPQVRGFHGLKLKGDQQAKPSNEQPGLYDDMPI
jgi:putative DNA primase/helicase